MAAVGFSESDESYFSNQAIKISHPLKEVVSQPEGENLIGGFEGVLYFNKVVAPEKERKNITIKTLQDEKISLKSLAESRFTGIIFESGPMANTEAMILTG